MKILPIILSFLLFLPLASCGGSTGSKEEDYTEEYKAILGILDKDEYSVEDLREIRDYISNYRATHGESQVAVNIVELGVNDDAVEVGLLEYTSEMITAFFEEVFPDRDPDTLPVTFTEGAFMELYSSQNS